MARKSVKVRRLYTGTKVWRNFSDKWKLVFLACSALLIFVLSATLTPVPPILVTFSGLMGGLTVMWLTSPGFIYIDASQVSVLRYRLERSRFHRLPMSDVWMPPLPAWLRWRDAVIAFEQIDHSAYWRVTGPRTYLRILVQRLGSD